MWIILFLWLYQSCILLVVLSLILWILNFINFTSCLALGKMWLHHLLDMTLGKLLWLSSCIFTLGMIAKEALRRKLKCWEQWSIPIITHQGFTSALNPGPLLLPNHQCCLDTFYSFFRSHLASSRSLPWPPPPSLPHTSCPRLHWKLPSQAHVAPCTIPVIFISWWLIISIRWYFVHGHIPGPKIVDKWMKWMFASRHGFENEVSFVWGAIHTVVYGTPWCWAVGNLSCCAWQPWEQHHQLPSQAICSVFHILVQRMNHFCG